ncbi:Predicted DNA-binding protein, UPF0251 family [Desulfonispora thiosulfatigenes DSM 11270]|uniref:UPF0251 protein SAMN00017405_2287 n=1 Tax=Desulfonispora thiosulfatigenes DSM 11270 TaxID=656914 RepID=A0A1W1VD60_DESTI|nr:DUF134 domain-containing protein [Desulfonispora thiosulfatigenes]SMB91377.1 Predicted DNA-binding protein, UPF0251 family [Desulfonispora thiosulfatigenes DSM 11270]
MARPTKERRIEFIPEVTMFRPCKTTNKVFEEVVLTFEEIEAIRLKDLESLEQEECAVKMEVSRPTFQRILGIARKKIANALIEGKIIKFEGGNYQVAMRHFECHSCKFVFEVPFGNGIKGKDMDCPKCNEKTVHRLK